MVKGFSGPIQASTIETTLRFALIAQALANLTHFGHFCKPLLWGGGGDVGSFTFCGEGKCSGLVCMAEITVVGFFCHSSITSHGCEATHCMFKTRLKQWL